MEWPRITLQLPEQIPWISVNYKNFNMRFANKLAVPSAKIRRKRGVSAVAAARGWAHVQLFRIEAVIVSAKMWVASGLCGVTSPRPASKEPFKAPHQWGGSPVCSNVPGSHKASRSPTVLYRMYMMQSGASPDPGKVRVPVALITVSRDTWFLVYTWFSS